MPSSVNDKFTKAEGRWSGTIGAGGVANGTATTIPLASVSGLPTDTAVFLAVDRVDSSGADITDQGKFEVFKGIVSGSNIDCGDASNRGLEGTAQAHSAGAVVEYLATESQWNQMIDGILVEHSQTGVHKLTQLVDTNGNETIKFGVTGSAVNEVTVTNAATTTPPVISATGGDTNIDLKLIGKGTGTVKRPVSVSIQVIGGTTDLTTGDGKFYFTIPPELNGMVLSAVHARVVTAGTTNTTDIQLHNVTDAVDILSTKLTIDSTETGSDTAATPAVINTSNDDMATNDLIRVDVDAVNTTAPKGLILRLTFGF